eukprot:5237228-Pyramimonas_sp.AAC.1
MGQSSGTAEHAASLLASWHSADRAHDGIHVVFAALPKAARAPMWALSGGQRSGPYLEGNLA